MILIITHEHDEHSDFVMEWVWYYGHKCIRLNKDILYRISYDLNNNEATLEINNVIISFKEIKAVWFRKYGWDLINSKMFDNKVDIYDIYKEEFDDWNKTLIQILISQNVFWLTYPKFSYQINKLDILIQAKKFGIQIPDTYIMLKFN